MDKRTTELLKLHRDLVQGRLVLTKRIEDTERALEELQVSGNTHKAEIVPPGAVSGR